jgi:hypothetical protein
MLIKIVQGQVLTWRAYLVILLFQQKLGQKMWTLKTMIIHFLLPLQGETFSFFKKVFHSDIPSKILITLYLAGLKIYA